MRLALVQAPVHLARASTCLDHPGGYLTCGRRLFLRENTCVEVYMKRLCSRVQATQGIPNMRSSYFSHVEILARSGLSNMRLAPVHLTRVSTFPNHPVGISNMGPSGSQHANMRARRGNLTCVQRLCTWRTSHAFPRVQATQKDTSHVVVGLLACRQYVRVWGI